MAKFPNITMTSAGLEMLARAASGQTADRFIVTKVKLGDGVSEGNIRDYTDVISPKKEVTLASFEDKGNGTFRYTFTYNNEGVKVGFYHREIGLFAQNGDSGTEKLVGYTNAGNYPGWIDDETRIQPYTRLMINVGIGDTDNASGLVDVSNAVTIEMLDEHNNNENAHTNLIKRLFGSATATMDSVKQKIQNWSKEVCLPLSGGTIKGDINASGHNITANQFIGNVTNAYALEFINKDGCVKFGGADIDENTAIEENKANLVIGSWQSVGFSDLSNNSKPINVAINNRNGNIKTNGSVTASGAMYSATPAENENSTRVATTAFVKSLFTANKNETGWYKNETTGIVRQWGIVKYNSSPNAQVIIPPLTFKTLLTCGATDVGTAIDTGNSFANMNFVDGKLYIRPVYGNKEPASNSITLRWWIDCLL